MADNKSIARAIGELLGRTAVGAVTLPAKIQQAQVKLAKGAARAGATYGKSLKRGVETPTAKAQYMPYMDEGIAEYFGRQAGENYRRMGKMALQTVPQAVGKGLYKLGEAEVELAGGLGSGIAQAPEVQGSRQYLAQRWNELAGVPKAVQQRIAQAYPRTQKPTEPTTPLNKQFSDALKQQIMLNIMGY